jgi:alkanesulfonate monooxygenase SsuD/methylene tetrahydromethanopterin reductase-like flavin-dependent oxidoreductase (luciferase family)
MMRTNFAIWDHFERREGVPIAQQYQEKIRLLQEAEKLGFYAYHIAEHHLTSLDLAPSPNVFLAALAQATNTLRFGTMVYIAPLYHPIRLVQEICMLDNLSNGRFEFGVGRGVRPVEHKWYQVEPTEIRERCEEILSILASAMATGRIDHHGKFYRIEDVPLDVLPVQKPYPPIWYAGGVEFAGANCLNFLGRGQQQIRRYWELYEAAKDAPGRYNPQQEPAPKAGIMHHIMLAPTEEKAMKIARRAWPAYVNNFRATPLNGGGTAKPLPGPQDFDKELKGDLRIIGTPQRVHDFLGRFIEEIGEVPTFYFAGAFQWGDIAYGEALESMQIFAEEVMPLFNT